MGRKIKEMLLPFTGNMNIFDFHCAKKIGYSQKGYAFGFVMRPAVQKKINWRDELSLIRALLLMGLFLFISWNGWGQPTALISGDATVCQNVASPLITFTGSNGTAPYTFTYTVNEGTDLTLTTDNGSSVATVPVPTINEGIFIYTLKSVTDGSGTVSVTGNATVTVNPSPAPITGTLNVCAGSTTTLACATTGGIWSSSAQETAVVDPGTGVVTGIIAGETNIFYTIGTGCSVTEKVKVNPVPGTSLIWHY